MGYSYQRTAAARTIIRARLTGNQQIIEDAEQGCSGYFDDEYLEEYLAEHYAPGSAALFEITDCQIHPDSRIKEMLWCSNIVYENVRCENLNQHEPGSACWVSDHTRAHQRSRGHSCAYVENELQLTRVLAL